MGHRGRSGFHRVRPAGHMTRRVFVLTAQPPESLGGAEHFIRGLLGGLEQRGYQTEIFHRGSCEPKSMAGFGGRWGKKVAGSLYGYWIGKKAQNQNFDDVAAVISSGDVGFYPLRCASSVKRIHFYHGTYRGQAEAIRPFIKYGGYLYMKWWNSMVLERLSGRGKLIFTCSEQLTQEVSRFFGYDSIPMWYPLDTQHFKPQDIALCRKVLHLPQEKTVGLFVGSLHPMKGFGTVRSLIERFPGVHWVAALRGVSPDNNFTGLNLTVLRNVSPDQLPLLYGAADFSLCPSLYEPFGYVVSEALACGTPVIASPGGASLLFLREAPLDRLLVKDPHDRDGFFDAVSSILREPELYRRAVVERIWPKLQAHMAPDSWWKHFLEATGL